MSDFFQILKRVVTLVTGALRPVVFIINTPDPVSLALLANISFTSITRGGAKAHLVGGTEDSPYPDRFVPGEIYIPTTATARDLLRQEPSDSVFHVSIAIRKMVFLPSWLARTIRWFFPTFPITHKELVADGLVL